ncbi:MULTISPECIES: Sec-independent protein translocase protein TatB [Brevundimonas]|jgi:sec-independent protein translocase protein TatB|nr:MULTISPECIES: Sec-independent protein translocase protein TatB [Brevundimonas]MDA0742411.1 Sec-independent protein translocase protein TatB [Pseudomonadota bacterium]MBK1969508.1 twin-arginine translocase subunit TatB [Brevundimonas diminuta]MBK1975289.1 twin-arginine translocase subunit TatB [Brevundimonas diminuta]MDA1322600.1 Sec-independent protein translocase protein TatB [Pseudomonadota bacterium]MDM8352100.1 Sec-independent protein translocase protein TatB [Brevundimonas diminuta]
MGGLGPGIGGFEILVIGLVALLVVGPKDLPMLMRKVGQFVGKARGMANEFRASFDEMARQSELDDLRKEVEALRSGQGMYALGADADEAFKDIRKELEAPIEAPASTAPVEPAPEALAQTLATGVDEWPDMAPAVAAAPAPETKPAAKPRARKASTASSADGALKPKARKPAGKPAAKSATKADASRPKVARTKKVDL